MIRITVLVAALTAANAAAAHDWYTDKVDPITKRGCCGGEDCRRIEPGLVQSNPDGSYQIPSKHYTIPAPHVQLSEDDSFHLCESVHSTGDRFTQSWSCFFVPRSISGVPNDDLSTVSPVRLAGDANGW